MNSILFFLMWVVGVFQPAFEDLVSSFPDAKLSRHWLTQAFQLEDPRPYFMGYGLDPRWEIEISSDSILFTSEVPGYERIKIPHQEPSKRSYAKNYNGQMSGGQLQIEVLNESCSMEGSNESFVYRVSIGFLMNNDSIITKFEGCGHYITDAKLGGRWILEQIKDEPVDIIAFEDDPPTLEIEPKRNSFSGFAGCNNINGRIFSEHRLLRFTDVVSTRMSCDHIDLENEFLKALGFSTQFEVADDQLILSNPMNTTLILRKEQ